MRTRWISTLLLGCLLPGLLGRPAIAADPAKDDITAIEFLGETDSASHPESQAILVDHLLKDPREAVRFAAVKAITRQDGGSAHRGFGNRNGPPPAMMALRRCSGTSWARRRWSCSAWAGRSPRSGPAC